MKAYDTGLIVPQIQFTIDEGIIAFFTSFDKLRTGRDTGRAEEKMKIKIFPYLFSSANPALS